MNRKWNVLIADDDQEDAGMFVQSLEQLEHDFLITKAADGVECLRLLKNGYKPDVVFLDLNMPIKNGLECLRDMQNGNVVSGCPVIIYSSSHNLKDITLASNFGARHFFVKPASLPVFTNMLKHVFMLLKKPAEEIQDKQDFVINQQKLVAA